MSQDTDAVRQALESWPRIDTTKILCARCARVVAFGSVYVDDRGDHRRLQDVLIDGRWRIGHVIHAQRPPFTPERWVADADGAVPLRAPTYKERRERWLMDAVLWTGRNVEMWCADDGPLDDLTPLAVKRALDAYLDPDHPSGQQVVVRLERRTL